MGVFAEPFRNAVRTASVLTAGALTWLAVANARDEQADWIVVARDSTYSISIDTTRILLERGRTYEVWYRTDHAVTRFYKEKAFTRETVHAILRCNNYTFRVISAAMSMGSRSPVAQQVTDARDLAGESWRKVEPGSTEADAARATCEVADWAASSRR